MQPAFAFPTFAGPAVSLAGRVEVFPGAPWPALNSGAGPAFAARLLRDTASMPQLYAVIGTADLPPRSEALAPLLAFKHQHLLRFIDHGTIDWPGHGLASVYVFAAPPGPSLAAQLQVQQKPLDEDQVGQRLRPLLAMLRAFGGTGLSHGALRLDNLYMSPLGIIAGECLSTPPSFDDGGYLTIERQQAEPTARGIPAPTDDLYALGHLVVALGLGIDPVADLEPAQLLQRKLARGSYNALQSGSGRGAERLRGSLAELARGLLDDVPARRWTSDEIEIWLSGRHPPPRPVLAERTASRPFQLDQPAANTIKGTINDTINADQESIEAGVQVQASDPVADPAANPVADPVADPASDRGGDRGGSATTKRGVAQLLADNLPQATRAVSSGALQSWVQRTLDDADLAGALDTGLAQQGRSDTTPNKAPSSFIATPQQVARAILLLDPTGPVRYRDARVLPSGYGAWLATRMQQNGDLQVPAELLASGLLTRWLQQQEGERADHLHIEQILERARGHLEKRQIGYGLERVLYELAPAQYCLSPLVRQARATSIRELLLALEAKAAKAAGSEPIDRHLAAFLIARDRRLTEGLLLTLRSQATPAQRATGILNLLAEAQTRHGNPPLPGLARWLAQLLEPVLRSYHRPATQARLRSSLDKAAASGSLAALVALVDDPATVEADRTAFSTAQANWARAAREIAELRADIERRAEIEWRLGQPIASGIAVLLGIVAMAVSVIMALRSGLGGML